MKFRNLTPHMVCIANGNLRIKIERKLEDPVVRVEQNIIQSMVEYEIAPGVVASIPLEAHTSYSVTGLPEPEEGVIYIVSSMVASRVKRADVVSPLTDASCERDESGRVISVKGFQTYTPAYGKNIEAEEVTPMEDTHIFVEEPEITPEVEEEPVMEPEIELEVIELPTREISFEMVNKVDMMMLDPIKAAARAKYEKRQAKAKVKQRR